MVRIYVDNSLIIIGYGKTASMSRILSSSSYRMVYSRRLLDTVEAVKVAPGRRVPRAGLVRKAGVVVQPAVESLWRQPVSLNRVVVDYFAPIQASRQTLKFKNLSNQNIAKILSKAC